jgi:hypothetical protein
MYLLGMQSSMARLDAGVVITSSSWSVLPLQVPLFPQFSQAARAVGVVIVTSTAQRLLRLHLNHVFLQISQATKYFIPVIIQRGARP